MMRSPTLFRTGTEPRPTRICVEASGGRARFSVLDQGLYLAPRPVHGGANPLHLRVALIGIHMMLLGGDDVRIEVSVGEGVTLEVVEPAGLVAYDAEGVPSRWSLQAELGPNAALIWDGASFVAAAGSNVLRETRVHLAAGARALVRETLVLGRSGESGGSLRSVTRLTGPAGDWLYDDLDLTGPRARAVGILGGSKVLGGATAAGWRPAELPAADGADGDDAASGAAGDAAPHRVRRFDLAAPGAVARSLAGDAHTADGGTGAVFTAWRDELLQTAGVRGHRGAGQTDTPA
ncbi:urease accessory protein UreD [Arthrobacter sp. ATA002]|uniref:urease accessory protein UreD n=1 Tax=Arthrobacter sp. ATA002 TaxID=2991715 RepID=UPI0022A6D475|nr:urease accessory protein UreD [Arthrobacter sp. ATA002]WAP51287.1 urease accessory protein UreD [Arthrobacter sp. ATA002]